MIASILAVVLLPAGMCIAADDNEEKRQKTRKMAAEASQDLYELEPTAQAATQKAALLRDFARELLKRRLLMSTFSTP